LQQATIVRLRVVLTPQELTALSGRTILDKERALAAELEGWVKRHYRDRLSPNDFKDPQLLYECRNALDELTNILQLGSIYEFQAAV
jgi:succinylarginine dihydrolase